MKKIILVFVTIFTLGTVAFADTPTPADLFAQGEAAYAHADYATAIEKWQTSYQLSGENALLFNLAQALRLAGDCPRALTTYQRFIVADLDPMSEQHKLAEDFARELNSECGAPPAPPPAPLPAPPPLTPIEVTTTLDPDDRIARPGRTLKITGLVTGGAGIAMLATGLILGRHAQTIGDEITDACRESCDWAKLKDKDAAGRRDAAIGRVLDGVGIAGIVGGSVLYYLGVQQGTVTVAPRPREGGAVISWNGSW